MPPMAERTGIAWTDHTFNPWWGCTKVSPGCDHCYAEAFDKRVGGAHWGPHAERRRIGLATRTMADKWNRAAEKAGKRLQGVLRQHGGRVRQRGPGRVAR